MKTIKSKRGAIELSVSTIVIVVLAMSMLILGLVLIKNIFSGAIYNVDTMNEQVKEELNKLFTDDGQKIAVYLPDNLAKIKQGETFGVAFGIKNTVKGESQAGRFTYIIQATSVEKGCGLTLQQADTYLVLRDEGSFELSPGGLHADRVRIRPSDTAPLCEISYDIIVKKDGQPYETTFFIVKIAS